MKLLKKNRIAGYKSELWLKTKSGDVIKYFSSVSGVDDFQADKNVYTRAFFFCSQAIRWIENPGKNFYIDEYVGKIIKANKLKKSDFEKMREKLKPLVKTVDKSDAIEVLTT